MKKITILSVLFLAVVAPASTDLDGNWEDVSTMEDGINPAPCDDDKKHCVFLNKSTQQMWTSVFLREEISGVGELKNHQEAVDACRSLKNWGGYSDWRLPTFFEMDRTPLGIFSSKKIRSLDDYFWTATHLLPSPDHPFDTQEEEKPWAFRAPFSTQKSRQFDPRAVFSWFCVRSEVAKRWSDVSRAEDGAVTLCSRPEHHCVLKDNRTNLLWSERSPGKVDFDPLSGDLLTQDDARNYCSSLRFAGQSGWRLPDMNELARANENGLFTISIQTEHMGDIGTELWSSVREQGKRSNRTVEFSYAFSMSGVSPSVEDFRTHKSAINLPRGQLEVLSYGAAGLPYPKRTFVCVKPGGSSLTQQHVPVQESTTHPNGDEDGDGVENSIDKCPNTPKGSLVWMPGKRLPDGRDSRPFWGCSGGQIPTDSQP